MAHSFIPFSISCSMKWPGVFVLPLDGMLVHRRSLPYNLLGFPNNSAVPIYTPGWLERGTVTAKCLAQEHNSVLLGPGLLDPGTSALIIKANAPP